LPRYSLKLVIYRTYLSRTQVTKELCELFLKRLSEALTKGGLLECEITNLQNWEQGHNHPARVAMRLLNLVYRNGTQFIVV
jgi:hypothetical protein